MVTYDLGNIADWLSAIGTISAVVVALYLSKKEAKPKARVNVKYNYFVDTGFKIAEEPLNISVEIVNQGLVPIFLSECTIQTARNEKASFLDGSQRVEKLLGPGEYYEHKLDYNDIKKYFVQRGIYRVKTYVFFGDASGKRYKLKIKFDFSGVS